MDEGFDQSRESAMATARHFAEVTPEGYIRQDHTVNDGWGLAVHFPDVLKCCYPDELRAVCTTEAFEAFATTATEDMERSVPRECCQAQVDEQLLIVRKMENEIAGDVERTPDNREGHNLNMLIFMNNSAIASQEKPRLLAEATVEKGLAKVEVETGKLNAAQENLAALESAATAADGADGAAADAGGGDALEEARAAAEAAMHEADEAKQSKSEELKAVQAEHKEATQAKAAVQKQTMLPAKKAKTKADQAAKMAARNKADDADALATAAAEAADVFAAAEAELAAALAGELAAKALVVPVQTEAKALDLAAKEAKKVFMAAKKEAASNATVHKQSDAKLKQAHSKVAAAEGAVARAEKALEKPRATLERSAEKVAEKAAALEAVEAHKAANEKAIADAIARIAAICSEGRPAEIAKIVAQHQASLDQLIADLEPLLANVAAIEKLRADRVAAHGQAEVDRRSGLQHKIHCLKKAENDRRDAVDRTCVLCKCVFHGRAAASAHATPIGQGGQQCPMLVAYFLNPHGGAPKVTFTTPEPVDHVMTTPPHMDGSFWGSEFEKLPYDKHGPNTIVTLDFYNDVCFNPHDGWWWNFKGDFQAHGKIQKGPQDGGPICANDYFATKVSPSQQPTPQSPPGIYLLEDGSSSWDDQKRMYTRCRLQIGDPPVQGDRYCYLVSKHHWWGVATRETFAEKCGVPREQLLISNAMF